jgi:hypothetical protein
MNILYEGLKEKSALMLVLRSAVESTGLGDMFGVAGDASDPTEPGRKHMKSN